MKRELGNYDDVDGSRTKRQKQVATPEIATGNTESEDVKMDTGEGSSSGAAELKEQGTKLLQVVKEVVNKECVTNPDANHSRLKPIFSFLISLTFISCITQRLHMLSSVHALALEAPLSRLLSRHSTTNLLGRYQEETRRWPVQLSR